MVAKQKQSVLNLKTFMGAQTKLALTFLQVVISKKESMFSWDETTSKVPARLTLQVTKTIVRLSLA